MCTCTFCLDISKYSTSIVCGQGVQNYTSWRSRLQYLVSERQEQYTDILCAKLSPLREVYGISSMPETGRLACTNTVARFSAARGNTDILLVQVSPLGEVCGMSSTPETGRLSSARGSTPICYACSYRSVRYAIAPGTGRLACTSAVSRFSAARGSILICHVRSERRPGKCPYPRAEDARGSVSESLECSILVSLPGARCPV